MLAIARAISLSGRFHIEIARIADRDTIGHSIETLRPLFIGHSTLLAARSCCVMRGHAMLTPWCNQLPMKDEQNAEN
jgi:hypothetical protein